MFDIAQLILIVVCLYVVIGVLTWLWSLRHFRRGAIKGSLATLPVPWLYIVALLASLFVVVFMWPWVWFSR